MKFENTEAFALAMDAEDPLKQYRQQFIHPQYKGQTARYFTGNSLGLQPKLAQEYVDAIMKDWGELAVEGHFYAERPWWDYHERLAAP
ncbi:MAG: kynureninase, partial [Bacteroidota bacterium]